MRLDEYLAHDATALADLVRRGEVAPAELLEIALERIRVLNPRLNAVIRLMEEDARDAAAAPPPGPFAGVPFVAKDIVTQYAGHPTSMGSRLLVDLPARRDSEMAVRIKAAGLVVLGKTNVPEWGLLPCTEPILFGPCRNPWDLGRTPGGSSGGSAAAVAAGIVPMAGGSDGGGSLRIPASCCGIFALKPTRGRTPTGPDYGLLWRGAVVEHALTRSVRDSAALLDATQGPDVGAPLEIAPPAIPYREEVGRDPGRLKVGFTSRPLLEAQVHADCISAVEDAARLLESMGHVVEEASPSIDGPAFTRAFLTMVASELGADIVDYEAIAGRSATRDRLEEPTWALALLSRGLTAREYATALRVLERSGRAVGSFFREYDILLTPTLASPPPPIGSIGPTKQERRLLRLIGAFGSGWLMKAAGLLDQAAGDAFSIIPWLPIFNTSGQPAMSVPLFWNDAGLPVGVHLAGRFGREDILFRLAGRLEEARPWFGRLPPLAREP